MIINKLRKSPENNEEAVPWATAEPVVVIGKVVNVEEKAGLAPTNTTRFSGSRKGLPGEN